MRRYRLVPRAAAALALAAGALLASCSDSLLGPPSEPSARPGLRPDAQAVQAARVAQTRYTPELLRIPGVVGTAVGLLPNGAPAIQIFLASKDVGGLPPSLDGVPVAPLVTGLFMARSAPTARARPAPLGYSVGHFAITAGTIGARVVDAAGNVYILSNNHVLANSNDAAIGDAIYQPGPYDGGTAADRVGSLSRFKALDFTGGANAFDAALAQTTVADVGNATPPPSDDGYGAPATAIYGDADGNGLFDNVMSLLGLPVQKFGRTTKLTRGTITGINATINVCYEVLIIFCVKSATFTDQLIIDAAGFSGGGDSGSLIVTQSGANPVGLLFAGSSAQTIANRIDLVLSYFGVALDGGTPPPPPPPPADIKDVAITSVTTIGPILQGSSTSIVVTVKNVGTLSAEGFQVVLVEAPDNGTFAPQMVEGLAPGASASVTFTWVTTTATTLGTHTFTATHTLADGNSANDSRTATTTVNSPSTATGMHIGDLDATTSRGASSWSATVEVTVHDVNHNPLNGATVKGVWSVTGLSSNTCTTGELGGTGTCIMLFPSLSLGTPSVTFRVQKVTKTGQVYNSVDSHDVDGGTNGIGIKVNRP